MAEETLESQRIIEYARWIRKSGKVLATISPENKDGLKQITDILWDSCIDFKNRKFDAVTDDYDYDIHELSTFILICDCLALLRTHPYFHKLRNDLDKCFSVIKKDPVSELERLYSTSPTIAGYPFLGSLIIDLCKPSKPKLGVLLNDLLNDLFDLVIQIEMNPNHDVLGKIFNELIPAEIRRRMGAFFTKTVYASLIARLSINKPDLKVLDLSCGSGILLTESMAWKQLMPSNSNSNSNSNPNANSNTNTNTNSVANVGTDIFGCDVLRHSVSLSWLSLLRFIPKNINYPDDSDDSDELDQNSNGNHLNINVFSIDALSISPETSFQSEWLNVEKGIRSNLVKNSLIPKVDVVLMNPPFSMGRSMDSGLKQSLFDKMTEYGLEKYIDKNMGLHGYFILHSDRFLNSGGKMSLIIPASTFDSDYSSSLIRFLKDQDYHIEYLIEILSESSAFSYNCTFKELIIIGIKGKLANNSKTKVVSIKREINEFEIEKVIDSIHNNMNDEFINIKEIQTNELYEEMNWVRVFKESSDLLDKLYETDRFIRLKDDPSIEVIRGFDGTYLEYVCLPNKRWRINELISKPGSTNLLQIELIHKDTNEPEMVINVPVNYLLPSIRSSKYITSIVNSFTHYIFNISDEISDSEEFSRELGGYFDYCSKWMLDDWNKKSKNGHYQRNPPSDWFKHPNRNNCFKTMGRIIHIYKYSFLSRNSVVVYCNDEISISNGFGYIIKTNDDDFYMAWFSSTFYLYILFNYQKTYSKGFFKVMVSSLNDILLPRYPDSQHRNITDIETGSEMNDSMSEIKYRYNELVKLGDKLPSLKQQVADRLLERVNLDKAWLKFLGVPDSHHKEYLNSLYEHCSELILTR